MAIQEYVGAVVLEVDGKEIECVSVSNDSAPATCRSRPCAVSAPSAATAWASSRTSCTRHRAHPRGRRSAELVEYLRCQADHLLRLGQRQAPLVHRLLRAERERPVRGPTQSETFCC